MAVSDHLERGGIWQHSQPATRCSGPWFPALLPPYSAAAAAVGVVVTVLVINNALVDLVVVAGPLPATV